MASYWYLGREEDLWVNWPECYASPAGAMVLGDAFRAQGRTYHHLSLYGAIVVGWSQISLPLEQFRFVSIRNRPVPRAEKESTKGEEMTERLDGAGERKHA
jgi:hypothetical protein